MPVSQYLDMLRRRVTHVEGGVADVQRLLAGMTSAERLQAARGISRDSSWSRSLVAGIGAALSPLGPIWGPLVARGTYNTYGSWGEFDRSWARQVGPRVRDLASRVARYEELGLPNAHQQWPGPTSQEVASGEVRRLVERGNAASNRAQQLARAWVDSPPGAADERNSPWGERWFRRATRGGVLTAFAQQFIGGERELASRVTGQSTPWGGAPSALRGSSPSTQTSSAEESLVAHGAIAPTRPGQAAPDAGQSGNGGGTSSWWSGLVTAALVVAGGYLVVQIVKNMAGGGEAAETAEEQE